MLFNVWINLNPLMLLSSIYQNKHATKSKEIKNQIYFLVSSAEAVKKLSLNAYFFELHQNNVILIVY